MVGRRRAGDPRIAEAGFEIETGVVLLAADDRVQVRLRTVDRLRRQLIARLHGDAERDYRVGIRGAIHAPGLGRGMMNVGGIGRELDLETIRMIGAADGKIKIS